MQKMTYEEFVKWNNEQFPEDKIACIIESDPPKYIFAFAVGYWRASPGYPVHPAEYCATK